MCVLISEFVDFLRDRCDPPLEKASVFGQVLNEPNHSRRQVIREHRENLWKCQSELLPLLPAGLAALAQAKKTSDLINDRGSLCHQSTVNSVQRLQVKLLGRFQRDETNGRALRRLYDGFGITEVIFVTLEVWLHILCRQEPYLMAEFLELATKVVCSCHSRPFRSGTAEHWPPTAQADFSIASCVG